ncbi:hypothetical protein EBZ39_18160, partial [bacterium]|nr:hypothetical protein [bacterium]
MSIRHYLVAFALAVNSMSVAFCDESQPTKPAEAPTFEAFPMQEHAIAKEYLACDPDSWSDAKRIPIGPLGLTNLVVPPEEAMPAFFGMLRRLMDRIREFAPSRAKKMSQPMVVIQAANPAAKESAPMGVKVDTTFPNAFALELPPFLGPVVMMGGWVLTRLDEDEIEMILAHELGHLVKRHSLKLATSAALLSGMALFPFGT